MENIYTLSMNPAIDLFISMDKLLPNVVNRTNKESYRENGKAVNISRILHLMAIKSTAIGFIGGFSGHFIKEQLEKTNVATDFIEIDGITRINVFLQAEDEFKIVNRGPAIGKEKIDLLLEQIAKIEQKSFLFISGSLPLGVDVEIYDKILAIGQQHKLKIILDVSDKKILPLLKYNPYLIKPNDDELAHFFDINHALDDKEIELLSYKLLDLGVERVLVSRGAQGACYFDALQKLEVNAPKGKVVNTTCAGDTMLATFIGKYLMGSSLEEALIFSSASASSTAFTEDLTDFTDVPRLMQEITIKRR